MCVDYFSVSFVALGYKERERRKKGNSGLTIPFELCSFVHIKGNREMHNFLFLINDLMVKGSENIYWMIGEYVPIHMQYLTGGPCCFLICCCFPFVPFACGVYTFFFQLRSIFFDLFHTQISLIFSYIFSSLYSFFVLIETYKFFMHLYPFCSTKLCKFHLI